MACKFDPKHNICAFLQVTKENQPLERMIIWLNRSNLIFALTKNPILYRNHYTDLWGSTQYTNYENVKRIEATVLRQEIEQTIRTRLQLNDDFVEQLSYFHQRLLRIIQETMGYQGNINEGQFHKGMFPLIYGFLIHHVIQSLSLRRGTWTLLSRELATATVAIVYNQPCNFS